MAKIRKFAAYVMLAAGGMCFSGKTLAQNPSTYYVEDPRTFYGGILFGTNFSQVDGDSYAGYHKVGLNGGGIVYIHLDQNLAGSMEILFSQKGSRGHRVQESGFAGLYINEYKINLNYAEIPLMLNYFDRRRSHFGGGFSYSQLITSSETISVSDGSNIKQIPTDSFKFRKSDINFVLGGNLHLWKGLFLNLRFQYSIIPIRKNIPPGFGRSEQFNNLWALRLMYLF
ncbi:MAG: PorT family protein [Sphingobacteriales bacterium]|nr:MAG: PorT family protein [Sphingobacteriales bacterium]